jgi:hypothetical protein
MSGTKSVLTRRSRENAKMNVLHDEHADRDDEAEQGDHGSHDRGEHAAGVDAE